MTFWTRERIEEARKVRALSTLMGAAQVLSERWGVDITAKAVERALSKAKACDIPIDWEEPQPDPFPALERLLIVPDVHVPFHDERAWQLMLKVARSLRPDHLVVLGDFADFWSVSSHSKSPSRKLSLADEVAAVNAKLDELDALGASKRYFCEGNHEFRLSRYLADKAPALFESMTVDGLFRLHERGWHFAPYRTHLKIGRLNFTHDVGSAGGMAHVKAQEMFEGNSVIGHVHRMGVTYAGNAKGESHVGASFGWLGDVEAVDYMHKVSALRAWQLGCGIGFMEPSGVVHLQAVPFVDYRCVVNGQLIAA